MASNEDAEGAKRKVNEVGAIGLTVGRNVARLRNARGLSTYRLAEILYVYGRPIGQTQISRIESGKRKVDVDDLIALARALRVSPVALLLPPTIASTEKVDLPGWQQAPSERAWLWMLAEQPFDLDAEDDGEEWNDFQTWSRPAGLRLYRAPKTELDALREHDRLRREAEAPSQRSLRAEVDRARKQLESLQTHLLRLERAAEEANG